MLSRIYGPHTEYLLRLAGIAPGMRVLDVGCGAGDVTLAVAKLVGPTGSVLGVDIDPHILDVARRRAAAAGAGNVAFARATLPRVELGEPVDALVGRLIVTHLPDRVAAVRAMARLVRPGGVVSLQDMATTGRARSEPAVPLVDRAPEWLVAAVRTVGADADTGRRLPVILREAGLADVDTEACPVRVSDPDSAEFQRACEYVVSTVANLRPLILQTGLAPAEDLDLMQTTAWLRDEMVSTGAELYLPDLVGAWARVPRR